MTRDEFCKALEGVKLPQLRELVQSDYNVELRADTLSAALDEAFVLYQQAQPALDAPLCSPPPPAPKRGPGRPPKASAPAPVTAPAAPAAPLVYEGRSRTGRPFHKAGRTFGVRWEPIGELSAADRALLDKHCAHVSYRVKG